MNDSIYLYNKVQQRPIFYEFESPIKSDITPILNKTNPTYKENPYSEHKPLLPIDKFIDFLIEGEETQIPENLRGVKPQEALQREFESRNLPPVPLIRFNGDASKWPEFIENFYTRVHSKSTFTDNMRMTRLLSVLDGPAKKSVEAIGSNSLFYATAFKALKKDFGNPLLISHLRLKDIFDKPQIKANDRISLKQYLQKIKLNNTWLKSMGYNAPLISIENVTRAVKRLPYRLRQKFYNHSKVYNLTDGSITLLTFAKWLEGQLEVYFNPLAEIIENIDNTPLNDRGQHKLKLNSFIDENTLLSKSDKSDKQSSESHSSEDEKLINRVGTDNGKYDDSKRTLKCWMCKKQHRLMECKEFLDASYDSKIEFVKQNKLCWNCLSKGHETKNCISTFRCRKNLCQKKHHTLLHPEIPDVENPVSSNNVQYKTSPKTFLQIIPVIVTNGVKSVKTSALLDNGSESTLISKRLSDELNLAGDPKNVTLSNVMCMKSKFESKLVDFKIHSKFHSNEIDITKAWVVENLTMTPQRIDMKVLQNQHNYLKDVEIEECIHEVNLLIGADHPLIHLYTEIRSGNNNEPVALKTKLGWVLMGGNQTSNNISANRITVTSEMTKMVENFWKTESYSTNDIKTESILSQEESKALSILNSTTEKKNNQYSVGLLWKTEQPLLVNNRPLAVSRLYSLEKKFQKEPDFKKMYFDTMNDYVNKGHAKKLTNNEKTYLSNITNYIPHHGVSHPNKPNKIRVVFDAAAEYKKSSLNKHLYKGPDLMNNLQAVLMRFRKGEFAIVGDIEQMFHQIKVAEKDQDCLRFLWRTNVSLPIDEYIMLVHLFGKKDSPCCANYVLKKTALDNEMKYNERVIQAVLNQFYMDDYLDSFSSINQAIITIREVKQMLKSGGFYLRKFVTNNKEIRKSLPNSECQQKIFVIDRDTSQIERALGVLWDPFKDVFKVKEVTKIVSETKRGLLSFISSIFDPLGIVNPAILEPKLIIQELWRRQIGWDEIIPQDLLCRWNKWKESLKYLNTVEIPRWYGYNDQVDSYIELHIFADASSIAYGAVSYIRIITGDNIKCSFITGKSRLAPKDKKTLTIPRLELQAAVIASRMKVTIMKEISIKFNVIKLWTDSKVVLNYLHNTHSRFENYVLHRTNEIRLNTNINDWNYIPTKLNVADDATRVNNNFKSLLHDYRWLTGPEFLQKKNYDQDVKLDKNSPDIIIETINTLTNDSPKFPLNVRNDKKIEINWEYYSSFIKIIKHVAWIIKLKKHWIRRKRGQKGENFNYLNFTDIRESETVIARFSQNDSFPEEYRQLRMNKILSNKSPIVSFSPFIDDNNLIRVGGRLKNTDLAQNCSNQIIISKNHYLAKLIIRYYHVLNLHSGREHTLAAMRSKFWVTSCRGLIKQILKQCLYCKRRSCTPIHPKMSEIPKDRLAINQKPFTNCGIDYFGPYSVKSSKGTRSTKAIHKRYGVVFTCLTCRAIHLELAGDLSTDAFILALQRFISRRGHIKVIRCDNGTNFIGAESELKHIVKQIDYDKVVQHFSLKNIEWKFNPPSSPWMGGVWEAIIKSVKRALRVITRDRVFKEDSLHTFLCEVESILNKRPLLSVSDDINDYDVLTPYHFLYGCSPTTESETSNFELDSRKQWRQV